MASGKWTQHGCHLFGCSPVEFPLLLLLLLKFLLLSNDKNQREFDVPGQEVGHAREGT